MKTDSKTLFTEVSPLKLFFIAAIPGMISMAAMSVYSIVEGMFIGQVLGGAAFAAQNLAMPFVMINFALADLVGVGSSVQISIALGRRDERGANRLFSASLILIFTLALLMGAVMFFASPTLLRWMGAEGETARLAVNYLRTYALCGPICSVVFAMDNYLRICGKIKGSMALNVFMSALTIGLLALFLLVFEMDIVGAALASSGAMAVCAVIAFIPFLRGKTVLRFARPDFSPASVKRILACGAPTFLNNIAGRVAAIAINAALLYVGGEIAVSAYGVLMYSGDFVMPFIYGLSDSLQPAIGYNLGAGNIRRVKSIAKCVFVASGILSAVAAVLLFVFASPAASLFVDSTETELLYVAGGALRLFCTSLLFRWFSFCTQGFFSAVERPASASVLSVASALVFPLVSIALLWPLGLDGLWLNALSVAVLTGILAAGMLAVVWRRLGSRASRAAEEK